MYGYLKVRVIKMNAIDHIPKARNIENTAMGGDDLGE